VGVILKGTPVKFTLLLFFEKFNGAPIAGSTFHSDRQALTPGILGPSSPTKLEKNLKRQSLFALPVLAR